MFSFKINIYLLSRFLTNSISYIVLHTRIHIRSRGSVTLCFRCDLNVSSCMSLKFKLVQNYISVSCLSNLLFNSNLAAMCLSGHRNKAPFIGHDTPRPWYLGRAKPFGSVIHKHSLNILFYTIVNKSMIIFELYL